MKYLFAILAMCGLCLTARAQFNPYAQSTLIVLAQGTLTNTTTAAVGVTNVAVDISGFRGIGSIVICITSNYANAASSGAVWVQGTSVSPTNTAISLWADLALGATSTSASQIVTNLNNANLMLATNTVFTPGGAFTGLVAITNSTPLNGVYEFGIPISDCPRYLRANFNQTGLGASYGYTVFLRARR